METIKTFATLEEAEAGRVIALGEALQVLQTYAAQAGTPVTTQLDKQRHTVRARKDLKAHGVTGATMSWHMLLAYKISSPPADAEGLIDQQNALVSKQTAPTQNLDDLVKMSPVYKTENKQHHHILQLEASITVIETRILPDGSPHTLNHADITMGDRPTEDQLRYLVETWLNIVPSMMPQT